MKYAKELDWTVPDPLSVKRWENHSTYKIIKSHSMYLHGSVADLGCNNGIACCMLSNLDSVTEVIGFDISTKAIADGVDVIDKHQKCTPDKIRLKYSNLLKIDSEDGYFDSAICFHTLEHIYPEDMDYVISEIARVLKPGGCFVFTVPCKMAFSDAKNHVSFFSIEWNHEYISLPKLLGEHGFNVIGIYHDATLDNREQLCITGMGVKQ